MDAVAKSEWFFFIASIAVVVVAAVLAVVLVYLARVLGDFRDMSRKATEEVGKIAEDLDEFRAEVKEEGSHWKGISGSARDRISGLFGLKNKKKGRKK